MLAKCRNCDSLDYKDVNGVLYDYCTADLCHTNCQPCQPEAWLKKPLECPQEMTAAQEADLADLTYRATLALADKYRAGQREHGGNGWEMGSTNLVKNAYDEVLDLTCYLSWLADNIEIVRELVCDALQAVRGVERPAAIDYLEQAIVLLDGVPWRK